MRNITNIMKNCLKRSWAAVIISIFIGAVMAWQQGLLGTNFNEDFSCMEVGVVLHEQNEFS